jgi:Putative MetA-pathway of phenol degradation
LPHDTLDQKTLRSHSHLWPRARSVNYRRWRVLLCPAIFLAGLFLAGSPARAQEPPYFVTYSHAMEEPDNLEIDFKGTQGAPKFGNSFAGGTLELEYGARAWWTTEVYLSGQTTANDSTVFTGFRWENRFRPLLEEHWINPVFYVEYEDDNLADRSFLEVTGHQSKQDLLISNAAARQEIEREMEMKLILSSNAKGWNFSGNFITEKDLNEPEPWEFGYALGTSRPLSLKASSRRCTFCPENFSAGLELYGGLGDTDGFGLKQTSHYLGPNLQWNLPKGPSISFSPNFGLNDNSLPVLYRVSVSYEIQQLTGRFRHSKGGPQ